MCAATFRVTTRVDPGFLHRRRLKHELAAAFFQNGAHILGFQVLNERGLQFLKDFLLGR
jgi:hypothetical protein